MLLLLDNCEHLAAPCAEFVSTLTARCPGTVVLMTSRSPLGLPEERLYTVAPMRVPPKRPSGASIDDHESVVLFLARARDVNPEMPLDTASLESIAEICRRCDGLPLAIELIASRCRALTPQEILEALDHEQVTLPTARPSAFERQRTIENTVAWSYELLDDEARATLDVASVFAPEFDLDALRHVGADVVPPSHTARVVRHLVDMSMLESHPGRDGSRFRALETIRLFGWAELETKGHVETATQRHADHYLALAQEAGLGMWTQDEAWWSKRLALELPNLAHRDGQVPPSRTLGRRPGHPVRDSQLCPLQRQVRSVLVGGGHGTRRARARNIRCWRRHSASLGSVGGCAMTSPAREPWPRRASPSSKRRPARRAGRYARH